MSRYTLKARQVCRRARTHYQNLYLLLFVRRNMSRLLVCMFPNKLSETDSMRVE